LVARLPNVLQWNFGIIDVLTSSIQPLFFPLAKEAFEFFRLKDIYLLKLNVAINSKYPLDPAILGQNTGIQMVMGRKAAGELYVNRLELIFLAFLIYSIVTFASRNGL